MSSTYSSDLRIQLMGTGDQAGTWGATTNNNFQYIFEQAIAGVQTVSVTATPQALTYLNGATATLSNNQAIAAALILTNGGVNANFTITTPSGSQKLYIIYNNTSYTATIQVTSSSGATIAIPAGVTTTVYTDGTNFYAANTGTVGAYGVNGALTVTGNASVGGTLGVTGNTTLSGTLAVTGTTTHTGAVTLSGGGTTTTPSTGDNSTKIATTAFVQSAAISLATIYPVGSIYMNTSSSTNPATLFGFGTWTALAPGQMLLGNGGGYTAGATGGSATTTISLSNLPPHDHSINDPGHQHITGAYYGGTILPPGPSYSNMGAYDYQVSGAAGLALSSTTSISVNTTQKSGSAFPNTAMTTISPYLVVYMWQRTA